MLDAPTTMLQGLLPTLQPGDTLQVEILAVQVDAEGQPRFEVRFLSAARDSLPRAATEQSLQLPVPVSLTFQLDHDPVEEVFFLRGEPLELSRQEYRLLRFLVEHPRQLLSPQQILAGVWEDALDSDADALRSCIYRLRQRLGPVAAQLIQTQRGGGYRCLPEPRRR